MDDDASQLLGPRPGRAHLAAQRPARRGQDARIDSGALFAALVCLAATGGLLLLRRHGQAWIDQPLILALNGLAGRWPALDHTAVVLQEFNLLKGGLIFALAAAAFAVRPSLIARARLAAGCLAAAFAALASRVLQHFLPHLPRPLFDPALQHFTPPIDANLGAMRDWSSFPSDNAALLFGVTLTVWLADRRIGLLAFLVFMAAAMARVYGGLHYPTDMLGGATLSSAAVFAVRCLDFRFVEERGNLVHRYRPLLAGLAFLFASQAASLFDDVRAIAVLLRRWL